MNYPLSPEHKARIIADLAELFPVRADIRARAPRESGDYAETKEGRKRRNDRREARARKREWLE